MLRRGLCFISTITNAVNCNTEDRRTVTYVRKDLEDGKSWVNWVWTLKDVEQRASCVISFHVILSNR